MTRINLRARANGHAKPWLRESLQSYLRNDPEESTYCSLGGTTSRLGVVCVCRLHRRRVRTGHRRLAHQHLDVDRPRARRARAGAARTEAGRVPRAPPSDRGSQYLSLRYSDRLLQAGIDERLDNVPPAEWRKPLSSTHQRPSSTGWTCVTSSPEFPGGSLGHLQASRELAPRGVRAAGIEAPFLEPHT